MHQWHDGFHLFAYGTLRRGGPSHELLATSVFVGTATVEGTLYDIDGDFPALVLYGSTRVPGEIWRCSAELLGRLDGFEGTDSGLFRRVGVQVGDYGCWTYVAGPALARRLTPSRRLPTGAWRPGRPVTG
jgi:gamma-glutamylcyclotransferase (GGCT)/AIG2-like uncharacterized protein YtfP